MSQSFDRRFGLGRRGRSHKQIFVNGFWWQSHNRQLALIYTADPAHPTDHVTQLALKDKAMQQFRKDYQKLKATWGGFTGYDPWVAQANNAALGAQAAYDEFVPGFEAVFSREAQDWPRFYDAVRRLGALPKEERRKALQP